MTVFVPDMTVETNSRAEQSASTSQTTRRAVFMAACAGMVGLGLVLGEHHFEQPAVDPALAMLLQAMGAIKMILAIVTVAAVFWRLGAAITARYAYGYGFGAALTVLGAALIAQTVFLSTAGALFHAGILLVLLLAWRDDIDLKRTDRIARA